MPFAIHALNVVYVIVLLTFRFGIGILWRRCNLFVGELPAPFTRDEYFHPRPSAASYNAAASASSSLATSNYALRDRVARTLGPIASYAEGSKFSQQVAPDVEHWFAKDHYQKQPHIVAQWAIQHTSLAQGWVKADPMHSSYVENWMQQHAPGQSH
jgi:K+-transporting ATPase ATPase C chain